MALADLPIRYLSEKSVSIFVTCTPGFEFDSVQIGGFSAVAATPSTASTRHADVGVTLFSRLADQGFGWQLQIEPVIAREGF